VVRNKEFARTLGRVLSRPAILPVPKFALRIALPEMGARGYRSVTVSELLAAAPIAPG